MDALKQKILAQLAFGRQLERRDLAQRLDLRGGERKLLTRVLKQMVRSGQLEEQHGRYRQLPQPDDVEGIFSSTDKGYGFVAVAERREDLFIPARHVGSAMDGDRVRVRLRTSVRDRRRYGEIVAIPERAQSRVVGSYQPSADGAMVVPLGTKQGRPVRVQRDAGIAAGDIVEVAIEHYAQMGTAASGRIVERLGAADDPLVDIAGVIRMKKLPHRFSASALQAAQTLATEVAPEDLGKRTDLRGLPLVTIDSETARDFDDAVALRKDEDGGFRLWVCIADVAHYVTPGSHLDQDAEERGTSVYFPGFVVPMLPEALSNGICSLNPHVDRLVMTAELRISAHGETLAAQFYPALMNSHARLTYTRVAACLAGENAGDLPAELVAQLQNMAELAEILTRMRHARGSLDLELSEVEVRVDDKGRPLELVKVERNRAHRLVEEFMLAANEAVARYLNRRGWAFLYRVHAPLEQQKLEELQQLAAGCGHGVILGARLQESLQRLLAAVAGQPEGRLINQQLLRSLQQAVYTPHNEGHFGLAAVDYCHFTSPIRRYPDLLVHRVLKLALAGQPHSAAPGIDRLEVLGAACSEKERRAMDAERDLIDLRRCQIMLDRVGEEFDAIIASVVEFGLFVELDDLLATGLVHIRSLQGDYYHFDPAGLTLTGERQRQRFHIGMPVKVRLELVDLSRRRLDFTLAGHSPKSGGRKPARR